MAEVSNLYLLVFPTRRVMKVGKADDVYTRSQTLKRCWGEVDYEASYQVEAAQNIVFRLEKSLLCLLSSHAVDFEKGDGYTEVFSIDALEFALKQIELYIASGVISGEVRKGVKIPTPKQAISRRVGQHVTLRLKSNAWVSSISRVAEQFDRINRLLIILFRKQTKIAYQYDIVDGYIYFRLLSSTKYYGSHDRIMRMFSFEIADFNGECGLNGCSVIGVDNVIQYKINLFTNKNFQPGNATLSCFWEQSEKYLSKLPARSPGAIQEIPLLDEAEVRSNIFGRGGIDFY